MIDSQRVTWTSTILAMFTNTSWYPHLLGWTKAQGSLLRFCDRQQQPPGRYQHCDENVKVMYQNCQTCQIVFIFKTNVVHNNCPSPLDETESLFHSFINQHLRSYSNSMLVMYRHVFTSVSIFRKGMERQKFFSTSSLPRYKDWFDNHRDLNPSGS